MLCKNIFLVAPAILTAITFAVHRARARAKNIGVQPLAFGGFTVQASAGALDEAAPCNMFEMPSRRPGSSAA
jgi:hypothetical protein